MELKKPYLNKGVMKGYVSNIYDYRFGILLAALLIIALILRCYEITEVYGKIWEMGYLEIIAKNYLKYGFLNTNFFLVMSEINGHFVYRFNHPPLFHVLLACSFTVFGIHEWSARIVPILFSLGSIVLLYLLASIVWGKQIALYSAFFATFVPIDAYFGRIVSFEPANLFFGLLIIYGYVKLLINNKVLYKFYVLAASVLGSLIDWPFLILLPLLLIYSSIIKKNRMVSIYACFLGVFISCLILLANIKFTGDIELLHRIEGRTQFSGYIFNPELYYTVFTNIYNWFTLPLLSLVFIEIIALSIKLLDKNAFKMKNSKEIFKRISKPKVAILSILLIWGTAYIILFPESSFIHTAQIYFLIPGILICSSLGLDKINKMPTIQNKSYHNIITLFILLAFVIVSINFLSYAHSTYSQRCYEAGLLIEENTDPTDLIAVDSTVIAYYSNRNLIGIPAGIQPINELQKYNPKVIEFLKNSADKNYLNYLINSSYALIYSDGLFEIWEQNEGERIIFNFISEFDHANITTNAAANRTDSSLTPEYVKSGLLKLKFMRPAIFEHPCNNKTFITYRDITIQKNASLEFGITLDPIVWSPDKGDGVLFEIYVINSSSNRIFSRYINPKENRHEQEWNDFNISLEDYAGRNIDIAFATSQGPKNDSSYDWAWWGEPRIVTAIGP